MDNRQKRTLIKNREKNETLFPNSEEKIKIMRKMIIKRKDKDLT